MAEAWLGGYSRNVLSLIFVGCTSRCVMVGSPAAANNVGAHVGQQHVAEWTRPEDGDSNDTNAYQNARFMYALLG